MVSTKRLFRTGNELWRQLLKEQHGEDRDIESHRGIIELMKNHRDAFLLPNGKIASERRIFFVVDGDYIESWNNGFPWVSIGDFEVVGQDSTVVKGSRRDMEDSVSGKEVGRLQIFRLAKLLSDGRRDFEVRFHCKNYDGAEASLRIFNWNELDGSYEVEKLPEKVEGTCWRINCERQINTDELQEYLSEQLRFFDTGIDYTFNGKEHLYNPPTKSEREKQLNFNRRIALPDNIGTAYVNYYGNGDFKVYNLGIKLRTALDINVGGISGTIVTDKFLPEDLGRGSLMQSDEAVSAVIATIRVFGTEHLIDKLATKTGADLTSSELDFLLKKARHDPDLLSKIETKLIIPRGNGAFTSISNIRDMQGRGRTIYWASGEPQINDKAMVGGMNVVAYSMALESLFKNQYEIGGIENLDDLPEAKQWEHGFKIYETPEDIQKFYDEVMKPWLLVGMKDGLGSDQVPELKIGYAGKTVGGWTNTKTYIVIEKGIVKDNMVLYNSATSELTRLEFLRDSMVLDVMIHEIAHWGEGSDSFKITLHSEEFNTMLMRVKYAIYSKMDKTLKCLLKEDVDMALWVTNVKTKTGSDGMLLYSVAIPREHAAKLDLKPTSVLTVAIKTVKDDDTFSKRGFSSKSNGEKKDEEE